MIQEEVILLHLLFMLENFVILELLFGYDWNLIGNVFLMLLQYILLVLRVNFIIVEYFFCNTCTFQK